MVTSLHSPEYTYEHSQLEITTQFRRQVGVMRVRQIPSLRQGRTECFDRGLMAGTVIVWFRSELECYRSITETRRYHAVVVHGNRVRLRVRVWCILVCYSLQSIKISSAGVCGFVQ
jgi:hypothetical protein